MPINLKHVRALLLVVVMAVSLGIAGSAKSEQLNVRFLAKLGERGGAPGQLNAPEAVAVGPDGRIYVADTYNHRVQVFDEAGTLLFTWGTQCALDTQENCKDPDGDGPLSIGDGQFQAPEGITIDPVFAIIYVADSENHRIQVFDLEGQFVRKWGAFGSIPGQFYIPVGLAIDNAGLIYVTDVLNHRIQVFNESGLFVREWGENGSGRGEFAYPSGITIYDNTAFVSDNGNHRIQMFTLEGKYKGEFGSFCNIDSGEGCIDPDGSGELKMGDGQFRLPFGISSDSNGNIFVVDQGNNRIVIFEPNGQFRGLWGSTCAIVSEDDPQARLNCRDLDNGGPMALGDGQFFSPKGIAVASRDRVFVADADNHRIQVFEVK